MTSLALRSRFAAVCREPLPLPGGGRTAERHLRLFAVAEEDVSLAKLAEAHWDALAILAEADRTPKPGALYAVWASEIPGRPLEVRDGQLSGEKAFCSGYGLVDRALVTVGLDDGRLLDVDLRQSDTVVADLSQWQPEAFRATNTGAVTFRGTRLEDDAQIGEVGFYLRRPGFWHGACGPAACWAGGAAGLLRFAQSSSRRDAHTLAHLGALRADVWALRTLLERAGNEIDLEPMDALAAQHRALTVRYLVEHLATDILDRFGRAYGPFPLTMHAETARRFQETEIFLRQSHAERDLETLTHIARQISESAQTLSGSSAQR